MRTFSVLHPTARSPNVWTKTWIEWSEKASRPEEVEYAISVHRSRYDSVRGASLSQVPLDLGVKSSTTSSTGRDCVVDNGNNAAANSTGSILIGSADDLFPPQDWDKKLFHLIELALGIPERQEFPGMRVSLPGEFFINLLPGRCTHFALSRKLYERWGHFVYPEFVSMYSDDDAYEQAQADGVTIIEAGHLGFEHRHHSVGMRVHDEVDREHASGENYKIGFEVIERRREARRKRCSE